MGHSLVAREVAHMTIAAISEADIAEAVVCADDEIAQDLNQG